MCTATGLKGLESLGLCSLSRQSIVLLMYPHHRSLNTIQFASTTVLSLSPPRSRHPGLFIAFGSPTDPLLSKPSNFYSQDIPSLTISFSSGARGSSIASIVIYLPSTGTLSSEDFWLIKQRHAVHAFCCWRS